MTKSERTSRMNIHSASDDATTAKVITAAPTREESLGTPLLEGRGSPKIGSRLRGIVALFVPILSILHEESRRKGEKREAGKRADVARERASSVVV